MCVRVCLCVKKEEQKTLEVSSGFSANLHSCIDFAEAEQKQSKLVVEHVYEKQGRQQNQKKTRTEQTNNKGTYLLGRSEWSWPS
jgi:hypothetical protein